jgi:hypothetical protein
MPAVQHKKEVGVQQKKGAPPKKMGAKKPTESIANPQVSAADEMLLQEIAENLEILHAAAVPSHRKTLTLPASLQQSIQFDETPFSDPNYSEILAVFLQNVLELPEYGEVKAHLEIDSQGQLTHVEILEARNQKNGEFLRKRLPELIFPASDTPLSFTITFKNQT